MDKTPFELDTNPLREASSPHAGALATSRAFRALGFPELIAAHLDLRQRRRGFSEDQMIESIVLLQTIGGDCPEDSYLLAGDTCLERGLGYAPPRPTAVRGFLERFHDESLEQLRPSREQQLSFIVPSSLPVQGLQQVLGLQVRTLPWDEQDDDNDNESDQPPPLRDPSRERIKQHVPRISGTWSAGFIGTTIATTIGVSVDPPAARQRRSLEKRCRSMEGLLPGYYPGS